MAKRLTQKEIEDNIKNKISELEKEDTISIIEIDFGDTTSETIIKFRCSLHNDIIQEIKYYDFITSEKYICKLCRDESPSPKRINKDNFIKTVEDYIIESNREYSTDLEIVGIEGEWVGESRSKITIRCNIHECESTVNTNNLIRSFKKYGTWLCPECKKEQIGSRLRYTPRQARELIENLFPDCKYDLSKVEDTYKNSRSEVTIHCPTHGDFSRGFRSIITSKELMCPTCSKEHKVQSNCSEEEALEVINNSINKNNLENNLCQEFIGFEDGKWNGIVNTRIILRCKKHGEVFIVNYNQFRDSILCKEEGYIGCLECRKDRSQDRIKTPEEALADVVKAQSTRTDGVSFKLDKILTTYKGHNEKVTVTCPIHGDFETIYHTLFIGHGLCPECKHDYISEKLSYSDEERLEKIEEKLNKLKLIGFDVSFIEFNEDDHSRLVLHCNIHNFTWNNTQYSSFIASSGIFCPECNKSRQFSISESICYAELKKYLNTADIIRQYRIKINSTDYSLNRSSGYIYLDFYIPSLRTVIEFNGRQHYEYIEFMQKSYSKFVDQVNRDIYVQNYCKDNNIKLLIIPYVDTNRIEFIIEDFIKNGTDSTTKVYPKLLPSVVENKCKDLVKWTSSS